MPGVAGLGHCPLEAPGGVGVPRGAVEDTGPQSSAGHCSPGAAIWERRQVPLGMADGEAGTYLSWAAAEPGRVGRSSHRALSRLQSLGDGKGVERWTLLP